MILNGEESTVEAEAKRMMHSYSLQFPDCPSISFAEVAALQTNSELAVVLVDVRTKEVNLYLIIISTLQHTF